MAGAEEKESRKRKLIVVNHEGEEEEEEAEEEEEQKIQTFFSLIRNMGRARHDIIVMNHHLLNKKKSLELGTDLLRFKTQDFVESELPKFPADPTGGDAVKHGADQSGCEDGVDLKLSL